MENLYKIYKEVVIPECKRLGITIFTTQESRGRLGVLTSKGTIIIHPSGRIEGI